MVAILLRFLLWFCRRPDFVVGDPAAPDLRRWWVLPRNRWFNVYLHRIERDDDDRAPHDHEYANLSVVLSGAVREVSPGRSTRTVRPGGVVLRHPATPHRLEVPEGPAWTLFVTGPRVRSWGFWCAKGWVPWREFVKTERPGEVGKGCGE